MTAGVAALKRVSEELERSRLPITKQDIDAFLNDRCLIGTNYIVPRAVLFEEWREWCRTRRLCEAHSDSIFGRAMRQHTNLQASRRRVEGKPTWVYLGVEPKNGR